MNMNMEELDEFFKNQTASYNNDNEFIPGVTPIYYSTLYWNIEEYKAGINAFLNGKWTSSGENVEQFERNFSRKFKNSFSLMVNSGSSANLILMAG